MLLPGWPSEISLYVMMRGSHDRRMAALVKSFVSSEGAVVVVVVVS